MKEAKKKKKDGSFSLQQFKIHRPLYHENLLKRIKDANPKVLRYCSQVFTTESKKRRTQITPLPAFFIFFLEVEMLNISELVWMF